MVSQKRYKVKDNSSFRKSHPRFGYEVITGTERNLVTCQDKSVNQQLNYLRVLTKPFHWVVDTFKVALFTLFPCFSSRHDLEQGLVFTEHLWNLRRIRETTFGMVRRKSYYKTRPMERTGTLTCFTQDNRKSLFFHKKFRLDYSYSPL